MNNQILWLAAGFVMMLAEFLVPGFIIFFFGLGALLTAAALWISPMAPAGQFVIFLSSSLLTLLGARYFLPEVFCGKKNAAVLASEENEYSGEFAAVIEEIQPGKPGKIQFHGSTWNAESERLCKVGELVTILRRINLTYHVK